jgi:hypothetical protein
MPNITEIESTEKKWPAKELFGAALSFLSILLGVFTFSLANAIKWVNEPESYPWILLALVTGFGIVASGIIAVICFRHYSKPIKPALKRGVAILVYTMLLICGLGTPVIGLWLYLKAWGGL